jgi:uncharacterized protein involved in exopolysaccharide biosynthesis
VDQRSQGVSVIEALEFVKTSLRDFLHVIFKRKAQIKLFFLATFCAVVAGTFVIKPTYEAKAHILVKVGRESMYVPATGSGNPVICIIREEQINSEIEILKGRSLIQDVVTSFGPATIYPDLDTEKKGILATVIPGRSRQDKTSAEKALLVLQKKLEVQGI